MTPLAQNLAKLEDAIAAACRCAGRTRSEVELMAVSKTYPASTILEAANLGLTLFGENRVQEFASKASALVDLRPSNSASLADSASSAPVRLGAPVLDSEIGESGMHASSAAIRVHLIGHLQSNKALRAADLFDSIDSVDSLRLAERLNEAAAKLGKRLPILLELKLSPEETKSGLDPGSSEAAQLLERLPDLAHIEVRGLMTIAPWGVAEDVTRTCFRTLRTWRDKWAAAHPRLNLPTLSMGMSGDFAIAIEEGATRIRIGTALFGKRAPYTGPPE